MKSLTKILMITTVLILIAGVAFRISEFRKEKPQKDLVPPPKTEQLQKSSQPKKPVKISIISALPIEQWVTRAAEIYNKEDHYVDERKISIETIPMDGLSALNKWAKGEFNPIPTAWIAESRAWVDQANIAALDRTGQDIFLSGGRYRTQPVVLSPIVWGIWSDAYQTLTHFLGTKRISWDELHKAAVIGYWKNMGGKAENGKFKMVVAHPKRDPAGLTAMFGAAGEYFDKPYVTSNELQNAEFLKWLADLFDTVVDFSPFGIENMFLYGRSNGDAGQIVESYLLANMEGLKTRWNQPLKILYPDPIAWFDFPYAIYMGKETSAIQKKAALDFKNYLLSTNQQDAAMDFGLRPASVHCTSSGGMILKWKELGVMERIPSSSRMRTASRKGLEALSKWYVARYEE